MSQREARKQILASWLDKRSGEVYLTRGNCPPGMSFEQSHLAAGNLADDGQAIVTFDDGKDMRVVTRTSIENGIKRIRTAVSEGDIPSGVAIPLGSCGNKRAIARESEKRILQLEKWLDEMSGSGTSEGN